MKSKNQVLKYFIISILLNTFASGVAPVTAQAATSNPTVGNTIAVNYESNTKKMINYINSTVDAINVMVGKGLVTNDILTALSEQLMQLSTVIGVEGASEDVLTTLTNVTNAFKNVIKTDENAKGYNKVEMALNIVNTLKDINTPPSTPTQTPKPTIPIDDSTKTTDTSAKITYATKFSDITSKSKNYKYIQFLMDKGCLGGYKDDTYKPSTNMSNSKFICILTRAIEPDAPRATKGNDYDLATMEYAKSVCDIFTDVELPKEDYNKKLKNKDMAMWVSRALEYIGDEKLDELRNIDKFSYRPLVDSTYSLIDGAYGDAVQTLYTCGILSKDRFSSLSTVTRSEAALIIARVVNKNYRKYSDEIIYISNAREEAFLGNYKGQEVKYNDANRGLVHDGMVWQNKAGKKIKIKSLFIGKGGWTQEIPGYGQGKAFGGKVDFYTGMQRGSAGPLKEGELGVPRHGDNTYGNQKLYSAKSPKDGATYVYFSEQWKALRTMEDIATDTIKNPKDGQISGYFMQYKAKYDSWVWVGPNV